MDTEVQNHPTPSESKRTDIIDSAADESNETKFTTLSTSASEASLQLDTTATATTISPPSNAIIDASESHSLMLFETTPGPQSVELESNPPSNSPSAPTAPSSPALRASCNKPDPLPPLSTHPSQPAQIPVAATASPAAQIGPILNTRPRFHIPSKETLDRRFAKNRAYRMRRKELEQAMKESMTMERAEQILNGTTRTSIVEMEAALDHIAEYLDRCGVMNHCRFKAPGSSSTGGRVWEVAVDPGSMETVRSGLRDTDGGWLIPMLHEVARP